MTMFQKHLVLFPICIGALLLLSGAVMLLWNWLMPEIFGLPELSFLQALGLFLLCKLLFGGLFGGIHGHHGHHGHGCHGNMNKLRERWESMSVEERERLLKMHGCCSADGEKSSVNG